MTDLEAFQVANNVQGWMRKEELLWLHKLASAQEPGCHWVEVGSWKGRSLIVTALGLPKDSTLDTVECFSGSEESVGTHTETSFPIPWVKRHLELAVELITAMRPDIRMRSFFMPSVEAAKTRFECSHDVVFIDAAHNEPRVTEDVTAWLPTVKNGGIFCGHDRAYTGVRKALVKTIGKWKEGAGSIWWMKK